MERQSHPLAVLRAARVGASDRKHVAPPPVDSNSVARRRAGAEGLAGGDVAVVDDAEMPFEPEIGFPLKVAWGTVLPPASVPVRVVKTAPASPVAVGKAVGLAVGLDIVGESVGLATLLMTRFFTLCLLVNKPVRPAKPNGHPVLSFNL